MVDDLADGARHLSLEPPSRLRNPVRDSTLESAGDAEGIFDLYGGSRNSWRDSQDPEGAQNTVDLGEALPLAAPVSTPDFPANHTQDRTEELQSPPRFSQAWEGPMSRLAKTNGTAPKRLSGFGAGPPITITPDNSNLHTPEKRDLRSSGLGSSTSSSPVHPSISRLSPRHPSSTVASASDSQVSIAGASLAGSIQYPGEDNDAFHVRSTYARLEAEGVHGDGWDPGVERTRGGPQQGKRTTMLEPERKGDVGEQEREFLTRLDRYGFVDEPLRNRSESRLALIPSSSLSKVPKLPQRSPIPAGSKPPSPSSAFAGSQDPGPAPRRPITPRPSVSADDPLRLKEDERVSKWMRMMSVNGRDQGGNVREWGWREGKREKVERRVYKGIPDRWRMAAWWTLAEEQAGDWKGKGRETRTAEAVRIAYRHEIDLPSTHDVQIDLDVPRTISGHTSFVTRYGSGQRSLFHVLHCFSLHCDECGYCQGMGPIAATLLCYFDSERAHTLLVRLHDDYQMHSIFAPGFPGLLEGFYVQERLMEWLMPAVYKSFQRNMISSSAWGTKWYITLFVNTVPFSQQLRLWDALWLDGRDVMVITAVAILYAFRDLLSAPTATFESILSLLSSFFVAEDEDVLVRWIRGMLHQPGVKSRMDGWRADWGKLVEEGKSGDALL